jgi:hypothetical protein
VEKTRVEGVVFCRQRGKRQTVRMSKGDELEYLCDRMARVGGENSGITISEGDVAADKEKGLRCLVGRIGEEKKVNKEAFKDVFSRIWHIARSVMFKEVQDNVWVFEFEDMEDKRRVMEGRPWSFDRQILVLNELDGTVPPALMQFDRSPFWVQVHDMPLICMNKGVGVKIGESLGMLIDVVVAGDGGGWGRCLRLRVNIDLHRPLERGRLLNMGGKEYWVKFRYEKLPMFCFYCGRILHGRRGCPEKRSQRTYEEEGQKGWGVWLRAGEPRRQIGGADGG